MSIKGSIRYIVVSLEIIDGERSYIHEVLAVLKKDEACRRCANRIARSYYDDGRKVRGEKYYQTSLGELIIKVIKYQVVTNEDVPVLLKYFLSV